MVDPDDPDDPPLPKPPKAKPPVRTPTVTVAVIASKFTLPEGSDDVWLARQEADRKAMQRTLKDAYDKIGKRDPKWDESARGALDLRRPHPRRTRMSARRRKLRYVDDHVNKAIQAGCDDPMLLYLHTRTFRVDEGHTAEEVVQSIVTAAEKLRDSKYSSYHRMTALRSAASVLRLIKRPEMQDKGRKLLTEAMTAYALAAKEAQDDGALRIRLTDEGRNLLVTAQIFGDDAQTAFTRVDDALKPVAEAEAIRQKLKGDFLISYAWDARGGGLAGTVTKEGWQLFHERLRQANEALESAWSLDAKDAATAARAITICKGLQLGDTAVQKWFDRAMAADPGCRAACDELIDFLDPKWGGSREKLVAFGRECKKSKTHLSGIPLLVAEAHARAFLFAPPGTMETYLKSAPVWSEIAAVHDEHFAKLPDDALAHASYAMYCGLVQKWDLASTHFQQAEGAVPASLIFAPEQFLLARQIAFQNHPPGKWRRKVQRPMQDKESRKQGRQEKCRDTSALIRSCPFLPSLLHQRSISSSAGSTRRCHDRAVHPRTQRRDCRIAGARPATYGCPRCRNVALPAGRPHAHRNRHHAPGPRRQSRHARLPPVPARGQPGVLDPLDRRLAVRGQLEASLARARPRRLGGRRAARRHGRVRLVEDRSVSACEICNLPSFWWQLGEVGLLIALALLCGHLQGVFRCAPPELSFDPPVDHGDHHAHSGHDGSRHH